MSWLWIILRYPFPADPMRQTAEAMRHRVAQLIHVSKDKTSLAELLLNRAPRLHLELLILDAEDCLRLWIAMRGCQIARIWPGIPRRRATPHLTRPKNLVELLARIAALVATCDEMEHRAQAHAATLKSLREADPLGAIAPRAARSPHRHDASHRASYPALGEGEPAPSSTGVAGGGGTRSVMEGAGHNAAGSLRMRGPPNSIAGANP